MIIVEVTFKIDPSLTKKKLREKFLETAPIYKKTPGLIRKNYISDLKNNIAGGVYCFDTMLNAKKCNEGHKCQIKPQHAQCTNGFKKKTKLQFGS